MQTSIIFLTIAYIGWALYWKTIGLALLCYFLFIAVKYYRQDISWRMPLLHQRQNNGHAEEPPFEPDGPMVNDMDDAPAAGEQFPAAYALAGEIKAVIADASHKKMIRQELLQAIRGVLLKPEYFVLQQTSFKPAINNLIYHETAERCSMELDDRDIAMLWE